MNKWMKKLSTWALLPAIALLALAWMVRHRWRVESDDNLSRHGLGALVQVTPFFDGTNAPSFAAFFSKVKQEYPDLVGCPRAANPFPGFLPKNRVYGRVLELPRGLNELDPASTPLMWDTRRRADDGTVAVLFIDGNSWLMQVDELEHAIEAVRSHGGSVWLGPDNHE